MISNNIYNSIKELSNLELQRKLWLNENNDTGLISSYNEVMCRLFDDDGFDDFIDYSSAELSLPNSLIIELNKLRNLLNDYKEKTTDQEIIEDSKWLEIVNQAKKVLEKWDKYV